MKDDQLIISESKFSVSLSVIVAKFDLKNIRPKYLNNGADLALDQTTFRDIGSECDCVQ